MRKSTGKDMSLEFVLTDGFLTNGERIITHVSFVSNTLPGNRFVKLWCNGNRIGQNITIFFESITFDVNMEHIRKLSIHASTNETKARCEGDCYSGGRQLLTSAWSGRHIYGNPKYFIFSFLFMIIGSKLWPFEDFNPKILYSKKTIQNHILLKIKS
jgi:hypothetical protein